MLPLEGIRVLALEGYYAGNIASLVFARFGAEVLKIEQPGQGDIFRSVGPSVMKDGRRRTAAELRGLVGKRSVALNLQDEDGLALFWQLVEKVDVVWTNLKPSSLRDFGISFESLSARNPRVVFTTLSGFGHDDVVPSGPLGSMTAFDLIAQGVAGLQFRAESKGDGPGYNGLPLGDYVTATQAALGTVLALFRREKDGLPQRVDVAMHDAMLCLAELPLGILAFTGKAPPRGRSSTSAPYGAYRSRDGWVNIAVGGTPIWRRFCDAIGAPELADDSRFKESRDRVTNYEAVEEIVSAWTLARTTAAIVETLEQYTVPAAPILDLEQVIENPQLTARHMLVTIDDPIAGKQRVIGNPIKMSGVDDLAIKPPPYLAEDTFDVLTGLLGMSADEVARLAERGSVGLPV